MCGGNEQQNNMSNNIRIIISMFLKILEMSNGHTAIVCQKRRSRAIFGNLQKNPFLAVLQVPIKGCVQCEEESTTIKHEIYPLLYTLTKEILYVTKSIFHNTYTSYNLSI